MTDEADYKKLKVSDKVVNYSLGQGDFFATVPTGRGYSCWGFVAGVHIEFEGKDLKEIEEKIVGCLTKKNIDYLNKASRCEEIALRIKESGLEKIAENIEIK